MKKLRLNKLKTTTIMIKISKDTRRITQIVELNNKLDIISVATELAEEQFGSDLFNIDSVTTL